MKAGYDWDITLVEIRKGVEVLGKIQVYYYTSNLIDLLYINANY